MKIQLPNIEICVLDTEHEDGTAWRTVRHVSTSRQASSQARIWERRVIDCGAPVCGSMWRFLFGEDTRWHRI